VTSDLADDTTALPQTCARCERLALLRLVGRCAQPIADIGPHHSAEHAAWRDEISAAIG
jgi:hypothetical protein